MKIGDPATRARRTSAVPVPVAGGLNEMIVRVGEAPLPGESSRPKNVRTPTDKMLLCPLAEVTKPPGVLAPFIEFSSSLHAAFIFAAAAGIYSRDRGTEVAAALLTGDAE